MNSLVDNRRWVYTELYNKFKLAMTSKGKKSYEPGTCVEIQLSNNETRSNFYLRDEIIEEPGGK